MAIIDKFDELLKYMEKNSMFLEFNEKIFRILEGDLTSEAEEALHQQLVNPKAIKESKARLAPINILKRMIDKTTKIYSGVVVRTPNDERYKPVVEYYEKVFNLNCKMAEANKFYNSTKVSALKPFEYKGKPYLRVLPPHQFLAFSEDLVFPTNPTGFVEFMGNINKNGKQVPLFFVYTDTEFLAIDKEKNIQLEYMIENLGMHDYGIVPFTYINKSEYLLIPYSDQDLLRMTILFVLLLTDMNYAVKYQAHSVIYGIDLQMKEVAFNPDTFLDLKSTVDGVKPELGFIKPQIDIQETINLITTQLDMWLESRNIKAGSAGKDSTGDNISGLSLMIKEMDTTLNLKDQIIDFQKYERNFWKMMINIHNTWLKKGIVSGLPLLPDDFEVKVEFELPKPVEDEDKILDRVLKAYQAGLMTLPDAIKKLNPKLDEDEILTMIQELRNSLVINLGKNEDPQKIIEDENQQEDYKDVENA